MKAGKSDSENKKRGNPQKVDEFRQAELEQYLEEALFLLELIGVRVFKIEAKKTRRANNHNMPAEQKTVTDSDKSSGQSKPPLPDGSLGPCVFVKNALKNLLAAGYVFSEEQFEKFGSIAGSKPFTTRNLPMFWLLKDGETRATCDKNVRARYWKDEFVCGQHRFLMYSQWYEDPKKGATKVNFINWYNSL